VVRSDQPRGGGEPEDRETPTVDRRAVTSRDVLAPSMTASTPPTQKTVSETTKA